MLRPVLLTIGLTACGTTIPDLAHDSDSDSGTEGSCRGELELREAWSAPTQDYSAFRGTSQLSADGTRFVWASGYYTPVLRELDAGTGELLVQEQTGHRWPLGQDASRDLQLWQGVHTGVLSIERMSDGSLVGEVPARGDTWLGPVVDFDAGTVASVTCPDEGQVSIQISAADGTVEQAQELAAPCTPWRTVLVERDSGGQHLLYATRGAAVIVDLDQGTTRELLPVDPSGERHIAEVAFTPDGQPAIAVRGELTVYHVDTGEILYRTAVVETPVNENTFAPPDVRSPFAWTPDGRFLARGVDDGTVVVERTCDQALVATAPVDDSLMSPNARTPARPIALHFDARASVLIATFEGGVQGFEVW